MRHSKSTRSVSIAIVSIAMLGGSCLIPLAAQASEHPVQVAADVDPSPALPEVKKHDASAFSGEAAQLPKGLKDAIKRDLKKSPEEYLAEAESAKDASDLQVELAKRGVQVTHSELVDGKLKLRVATEEQAKLARKSGADVTVGPADPPKPAIAAKALASNNGTGWAHFPPGGSEGEACSIGFYGYDKSGGQQQFLTAGHCNPGTNPISRLDLPRAGQLSSAAVVATTSTNVAGTFRFGGGLDAGLIKPDAKFTPTDAVDTWEGTSTGRPSITALRLRGTIVATVGSNLCKSGITTGWTCGSITHVNVAAQLDGGAIVNSIVSNACGDHGDSGGADVIGQYAVGITSGGGAPCGGTDPFLTSYPLRSADSSKSSAMAAYDWEPRVQMTAPTFQSGLFGFGANVAGHVGNVNSQYRVEVYWDGATLPSQTVQLSASGNFSFKTPTSGVGHTYRIVLRWGERNTAAITGAMNLTTPEIAAAYQKAGGSAVLGGVSSGVISVPSARNGNGVAQVFTNGSIYSSAAGAFVVRGAVRNAYFARGGSTGEVGWPLASESCSSGVCSQRFQFWTITTSSSGASLRAPEIAAAYANSGGPRGPLGAVSSAVMRIDARGGGVAQAFERGSIYYRYTYGAFIVLRPNLVRYWATGGPVGSFGWPTGNEACQNSGATCTQQFQQGKMYRSYSDVSRTSTDAIFSLYGSTGGSRGRLGVTGSDLISIASNGGGLAQAFASGSIYAKNGSAPFIVSGQMRAKYFALGGSAGSIGWPSSAELCNSGSVVCSQKFDGGKLYRSLGDVARTSTDAIFNLYGSLGGAGGSLGATSSDLLNVAANGTGKAQAFVNGSIYSKATSGTWAVQGKVLARYFQLSGAAGSLGWPTGALSCNSTTCSQRFEGGTISVPK